MANAKRCDICGAYYEVPNPTEDMCWSDILNTSMVRVLRRKPITDRIDHEVMQFDSCEACLQDVIDYILTKRADATCQE